jgi:transcriptional regulator with XRE-family HTH domain
MSARDDEKSSKTGSRPLGDLIKRRRESLGMSRQELAERTGLPYPTLAQIETAYRKASPSRLRMIAEALSLDPAELFDVLTSDELELSTAGGASGSSSSRPGRSGQWIPNPAYAKALPAVDAVDVAPARHAPDVVDQVVALLSELPAGERLDTLARVQSRLLSGLVQEEVRRATHSVRDDK